jgi:hypothetical protein
VSYAARSRELDGDILRTIDAWHRHGTPMSEGDFDDLALRIFAYQLDYNGPYARYCASLGISPSSLPASWEAIPPVPAAAFKETTLTTFDPAHAALAFETSGTTTGTGGRHYMETRVLYDAALLAGFDRAVLHDGARLRYLNLVPNPADRPQSSLGYMMAQVAATRGDGQTGWYVRGETFLFEALIADAGGAIEDAQPVCIATTAFALAQAVELLETRALRFDLPPGSRIMETGGFKGRTRTVERPELYARASRAFGIPLASIVAEYGMTELTSQYYDVAPETVPRLADVDARRKAGPPWLRARIVGPQGRTLPDGVVGAIVHVDLANRSSCVAIATEDMGVRFGDGFVLLGREAGASLRGCSLDAESLAAR